MIVDPDFPDHWKTRLLVDLLEDESAPLNVIRLWAHCQNRRTHHFEDLNAKALKAICRYPGDPDKFEAAMVSSGFVVRTGSGLEVCGTEDRSIESILWQPGDRSPWLEILDVSPGEWKRIRLVIIGRDGLICCYCGSEVSERPSVDHMIPVARGGLSIPGNLCVACKTCNSSKGSKTPLEFVAAREGIL